MIDGNWEDSRKYDVTISSPRALMLFYRDACYRNGFVNGLAKLALHQPLLVMSFYDGRGTFESVLQAQQRNASLQKLNRVSLARQLMPRCVMGNAIGQERR